MPFAWSYGLSLLLCSATPAVTHPHGDCAQQGPSTHRLNFEVVDVNRSPASSTFGYCAGGQTGTTFAFSVSFRGEEIRP